MAGSTACLVARRPTRSTGEGESYFWRRRPSSERTRTGARLGARSVATKAMPPRTKSTMGRPMPGPPLPVPSDMSVGGQRGIAGLGEDRSFRGLRGLGRRLDGRLLGGLVDGSVEGSARAPWTARSRAPARARSTVDGRLLRGFLRRLGLGHGDPRAVLVTDLRIAVVPGRDDRVHGVFGDGLLALERPGLLDVELARCRPRRPRRTRPASTCHR